MAGKRGPGCYTVEREHWQKRLQRKAQAQSGEVTYPRSQELGKSRGSWLLSPELKSISLSMKINTKNIAKLPQPVLVSLIPSDFAQKAVCSVF